MQELMQRIIPEKVGRGSMSSKNHIVVAFMKAYLHGHCTNLYMIGLSTFHHVFLGPNSFLEEGDEKV